MKPLTLSPHGLVAFQGFQPPHYSSGTRPDGRQFPELNEAARALLRRVAAGTVAPVNPDPYGIEERKARRRAR